MKARRKIEPGTALCARCRCAKRIEEDFYHYRSNAGQYSRDCYCKECRCAYNRWYRTQSKHAPRMRELDNRRKARARARARR